MSSKKYVAIILAAGAAKRMGEAKQLLEYKGKSLLGWTIDKTLSLKIPVVVVLGANGEHIRSKIDTGQVSITMNRHWKKGMSTSIGSGLQSALELVPGANGVLLILADQPAITGDHLRSLLSHGISSGKIVATEYQESLGVPAYFPAKYFDDLRKLSGDQGAKSILNQSAKQVLRISFEPASLDIDTRQDWLKFVEDSEAIE